MISAIITTYKRAPEILDRAIRSILSQTYRDIQLIVVDDSPADYPRRDEIKELVTEYSSEDISVQYIPHEKNMGACKARNTGLAAARGEFVAYLDDDDEWLPRKLELQLQEMERLGETAGLVYCGNYEVEEQTGKKTVKNTRWSADTIYEDLLTFGNFVGSTSFPLMRTSVLRDIGGFDEELLSAQDYDVWVRVLERSKAGYVTEPLAVSYFHEGERITTNIFKRIQGQERFYEKNRDFFDAHPSAAWRILRKLAPAYARSKQMRKAFCTWSKVVQLQPQKVRENIFCFLSILWGRMVAQ